MSIENRIKSKRKELNLTQRDLAQKMDISVSVMNRIEKGSRAIRDEELIKLTKILEVSPKYLLGLNKKGERETVEIPLYRIISRNSKIFSREEIIGYEEIPSEWQDKGEFFALRIKGVSMMPRFVDGDVAIVKRQSDCENGELAIVLVGDDIATLKQVKKYKEGIELIGYNTSVYPPHFYSNEEIKELSVEIIGVAVEIRVKI
ncbi:LexA family protein [Anaerosphaera multitolerans]|uniref:Helix-turn-helix domain-containing protein n=1 Tax=Anaerosphaera multitolerans TaxID=2487351 RepID=A0A437S944_9FIRM|nr:XRE family transcriptional regulator [Anaerosphaera multitolerans]RVU55640.1 helix-turn-helix domain-containing protein [Anaerosphaera multitolerans]